MEERWLDIDEAVAYVRAKGIKTTKRSLYTKVSRYKKPRSYKIGGQLLFKPSDLDAWIASITKER
jgi:hypothetical protein